MSPSVVPVGRTAVGRDVALHVGHPLAAWIKWILLHPRLALFRRNKRKTLIAIIVLPRLIRIVRDKLKNALALPPADFRGKWLQVLGGEIGVSTITQTGKTLTFTNSTQPWSPAVATANGSRLDFVQPAPLKGLSAVLQSGNRIEFSIGTAWERQESKDEVEEKTQKGDAEKTAPIQARKPPSAKARAESLSLVGLLQSPEGNMGYKELVGCACLSFAGSVIMSKKAVVLGKLLSRQYEVGISSEWLGYVVAFPVMCLLNCVFVDGCGYLQSRISVKWRRNLTAKLHDLYFSRMRYYRILNESDEKVPDPDRRICSDVNTLVEQLSLTAVKVTTAFVYVCYFGRATLKNRHWSWSLACPAYMFSALASIIAAEHVCARRFGVLAAMHDTAGKFQQLLTRIQLHAERVSMLQGEQYELKLLDRKVEESHELRRSYADASFFRDTVEHAMFNHSGANFNEFSANVVAAFVTANNVSKHLAESGLTAPLDTAAPSNWIPGIFGSVYLEELHGFFNASLGWGNILQAYVALQSLTSTTRIKELYLLLVDLETSKVENESKTFIDRGPIIRFDDVTIQTPTANVLLQSLSFEVAEGSSLLICGHNGAGKSSIIRALCNLWPIPNGQIARPGGAVHAEENHELHDEIYYLPQKPCNVLGTLSDQLTYPLRPPGGLPEEELRRWLSYVDLEYLVDRKVAVGGMSRVSGSTDDSDIDWEVLLSMGEQQALSIARLLYHHPRFAILDECTSAVGKVLERRLFEAAKVLGITCITITHRPALKEHHDRLLQLTGVGGEDSDCKGWHLSDLPGKRSQINSESSQVERCSSSAEVHQRVQELLLSECTGSSVAQSEGQRPAGTHRELTEQRSAPYKQKESVSSLTMPQEAVLKRWPGSLSRLWAILRLGVQTREQQKLACQRLAVMCVFGGLRVKTYWDYWRSFAGMIRGGLAGDLTVVVANVIGGFVYTYLSTLCEDIFKHQATKLAYDSWRATMDHIQKQVMRRGILVKVMSPKGLDGMIALENPVLRLSEFQPLFESVLEQVKDAILPFMQGVVMLPWMVRALTNITPGLLLANFFLFRGSQLLAPNFPQIQMREAALESRFQVLHTRLRSIAEAVAFSGGGAAERRIIEPHLEAVLKHKESSSRAQAVFNMMLSMFTDYRQLPIWAQRLATIVYVKKNSVIAADGSVPPDTIVANFLFDRSIQFTQQATQKLVRLAEASAKIDGQCMRCLELMLACNLASSSASDLFEATHVPVEVNQKTISVCNLDLVTPRGVCLATDISFDIVAGSPMVITGPNASGKSLLGSVLLGLWPKAGSNSSVSIPNSVDGHPPLSFLMPAPQQIYLPLGNLISQLMYPYCFDMSGQSQFMCYVKGLPGGTSKEDLLSHFIKLGGVTSQVLEEKPFVGLVYFPSLAALFSAILRPPRYQELELECDLSASDPRSIGLPALIRARRCLQAVGIDHVLLREKDGWLQERAWEDILSGGEKQRLCVARVLYHQPAFALLDECTSMVAVDAEEDLYRQVFNKWNITPITLTQRLFMTNFYDRELSLGVHSASGWKLGEIDKT